MARKQASDGRQHKCERRVEQAVVSEPEVMIIRNTGTVRAQTGEAKVHNRAEMAKAAATRVSDRRNSRPIAGSTDCRPMFPAAAIRLTVNRIMKAEDLGFTRRF